LPLFDIPKAQCLYAIPILSDFGTNSVAPDRSFQADSEQRIGNRWVRFLQLLFLAIALLDLDGPFVSAHNERQNQTFDISRHVFHEGWRALLAPKASFSLPGHEEQRFTIMQLEFPFHGLIGWPLTMATAHQRAVVRLVSLLFALASIQLLYSILRFWFRPAVAAAGTALWTTAPLVLHFGQVPMPDIVCTAGMLWSLFFALRGNLLGSSAAFLFAILAKVSVIVFGLPVLTALLLARRCRSARRIFHLSILWGLAPLSGLLSWILLLYLSSPPNQCTLFYVLAERGDIRTLATLNFYALIAGCLLPFGVGVLGTLALGSLRRKTAWMNPWMKWTILISNLGYLVLILRKIPEPQYLLPPLVWLIVAASPGIDCLLTRLRSRTLCRPALVLAIVLHVSLAIAFTCDLKASRVPDYTNIESAAALLPINARVVVVYRFYGASPAVWLNKNVFAVPDPDTLESKLPRLVAVGFTHLVILDMESRHDLRSLGALGLLKSTARLLGMRPSDSAVREATLTHYTEPSSPVRQFCDRRFLRLLERRWVILYSLGVGTNANSTAKSQPGAAP